MDRRGRRCGWLALGMILGTLSAGTAGAHDLSLGSRLRSQVTLSRSTWSLTGSELRAEVRIDRDLAAHLVTGATHDDPAAVPTEAIEGALSGRLDVHRGESPCPGTLMAGEVDGQGVLRVALRYRCPDGPEAIRVAVRFLSLLGQNHRNLAVVDDGSGSRTEVLQGPEAALTLRPGAGQVLPLSFLVLGIEHILGGWDHLLFLMGLLLLGGTFRSLLATITAFTLAHSVTLGLAALHVVSLGPRIVEPAIGLTIAYVGVENLWLREPRGRWRIALALGLIHGFAFASALAEAGLSQQHLLSALLLFNAGVELGQMAVMALVLPAIWMLRRPDWGRQRVVPALSIGVALTGATLFVVRVWS
ncbi:MAG TPA: HupE/UreJ family protein [Myxococcota bacterium]|nr:HupE/UreJ family protein [Myxococcota bacterium]HQK50106.1 HupE/UreJ family protein [Myxococcota bacterium]